MAGRHPQRYMPHHGGAYGGNYPELPPNPYSSNHPQVYYPASSQLPQRPAQKSSRRRPPAFPVEVWERILSFVPREDQLSCSCACRMFHAILPRFLLSTVSVHMENEAVFDRSGQCNASSREGTQVINTVRPSIRLLVRITNDPNWAKHVRTMAVFMDHDVQPQWVSCLEAALGVLPHLRAFRLVAPDWRHLDDHRRQGSVQRLIQCLLVSCRNLKEVVIPHSVGWTIGNILCSQPHLRKLMCCSELSTDMRVTDTNARHFVQHTQQLTSSLPRNTPLVPRLTSVALDQLFLPMVPAQVLGQLTALTVYNLWDLAALTNDTLAHTPALRSLTLHESEPQSDRDAPEPGVQLAPGEPDVPFKEPVYGGSDDTFTALMPRSGARDALRHLAAFKYVAYADVLPPALTAHLGAFLAARRGLRRVDIKAVVLDREGVRAVLRALRALPGLAVLGLEFRARRDAVGAGLDVLGRVPRTVTHLKFSVLGWDLAERATTAETVVKHALACLPRLEFLHLFDGIRRASTDDYVRLRSPPSAFDWGRLRFLALEYHWMDVSRGPRGEAVVASWPPRLVMWCWAEAPERLSEDGEWLMRYNRDCEEWYT